MKIGRTIVSKIFYDEKEGKDILFYFYATVEMENKIAHVKIDEDRPLSGDEVDEFNKRYFGFQKLD